MNWKSLVGGLLFAAAAFTFGACIWTYHEHPSQQWFTVLYSGVVELITAPIFLVWGSDPPKGY
jgi:hypothetical protein